MFQQLIQQFQNPNGPDQAQVAILVGKLQNMIHQVSFYGNYLITLIKAQPLEAAEQFYTSFSGVMQKFIDLSNFCALFQSSSMLEALSPLFETFVSVANDLIDQLGDCDAEKKALCAQLTAQIRSVIAKASSCNLSG